jgi:hypothetical protein
MSDCAALWRTRGRDLAECGRALAAGQPGVSHRLHAVLRHIATTASALGRGRLARRARRTARRLTKRQALERNRRLLVRARELALLSPEAAAGLDAGWEDLAGRAERDAARASRKELRRLQRKLSALSRRGSQTGTARIQDARDRAREAVVSPPGPSSRAREIRQYRRAVRACVVLGGDLAELAGRDADHRTRLERQALESLDRWHDVRRFRRRLVKSRLAAERQGAVTLVSELDVFLAVLERAEKDARRLAHEAASPLSNVVPLPDRTAAGG